MSRRYQEGCLYREKRKAGSDVWVFRYRDGQHNRKEQIGTVEEFLTKSDALQGLRTSPQRHQPGCQFRPHIRGVGRPLHPA